MSKGHHHWKATEMRLFNRRQAMCGSGATREAALADTDAEQQANNRRYNRINRNGKTLVTTLK